MKTKLLLLLTFLFTTIIYSQNLIAVQNGNTPSFYEDVNEAFDNAVEGDTLYFPGGSFNVNRTINKTLHIIGTGHNPNSTTATGGTIFASGNTNISQLIYTTGGGGTVTGIAFTISGSSFGNIRIDADINSLIIDRVILPTGFYCYLGVVKDLLVIRCSLRKFDIREINSDGILPSGLIANNVIFFHSNYATNLSIENNLFLISNGNGSSSNPPIVANGSSVLNNIFNRYSSTSIFDVAENSSFRNNAGFGGGNAISGTNFLSNNINHNTTFNNIFISSSAYPPISSIYTSDFHLNSDSNLLTAANNGGQVGIYGGRFPWKDGSIPFNPHIVSKNISGNTDENANLPVEIEVEAQQN